ncbi:glycoside hydrolase domain-containing protein [Phocaeicola dorei]|uniref:glycoside hydrolase domain-containing protein n=1 Tax=Phocaeicola dorei TaxID=357276 RepID=UPI0030034E58
MAGRPERTQELIREIFDTQYHPEPDGLCGNDDCGQMSAWYMFSAMGFYPVDPVSGNYVFGAPQMLNCIEPGRWKDFHDHCRRIIKGTQVC